MYPDCLNREIIKFLGPWPRLDPYSVDVDHALFAQNCQYIRGQAGTRFGHSLITAVANKPASAMFNWMPLVSGAPKNYLIYYSPPNGGSGGWVYQIDLATNIATQLFVASLAAYGASFADAGSRLFFCFYDQPNTLGARPGAQVYDATTGNADLCFRAPLGVGFTTTTLSAGGVCDLGQHRLGFLMNTRNGYTTMPCPADGTNTFAPTAATPTAGNQKINLLLSAGIWTSMPDVLSVTPIMTTVQNQNKYFLVPGATTPVNNAGMTITISISDADLAVASPADSYFNLLGANVNTPAIPPFYPFQVLQYLQRMVYIGTDAVVAQAPAGFPVAYISDPNKYQNITANQHAIYLPGNRRITAAFQLRGTLYLLGPHWTYSLNDSGDVPINWPGGPQLVDGSIGSPSLYGVFPNPAQGYAWVADTGGLYLFTGGHYPSIPVSYYQQTDWNRINWQIASQIFVLDDKDSKKVIVFAPLDGAITPTHELTWDYTDGVAPDLVKYSLNSIGGGFKTGAACIVQNNTSMRLEPWMISQQSDGSVIRKNIGTEANPYRDSFSGSNVAINSIYETPLMPGIDADHGYLQLHQGAHLRILGSGSPVFTYFSLDHTYSFTPPGTISLTSLPGQETLIPGNGFLSEQASLQIQTNALDSYFVLAGMRWYYNKGPTRR